MFSEASVILSTEVGVGFYFTVRNSNKNAFQQDAHRPRIDRLRGGGGASQKKFFGGK